MAQAVFHKFFAHRAIQQTFLFTCVDDGSNALFSAAVTWIAGEVRISKDGGAAANTTNLPTRIGTEAMYSLVLTATELDAVTILVTLIDATGGAGTPSDTAIQIQTARDWMAGFLREAVAQGGAVGSITLDSGASAIDDFYNENICIIISGTGVGQARPIVDYVGSTKVASVPPDYPWKTAPDSTSGFCIIAGAWPWETLEGAEPTSPIPAGGVITMREAVKRLWRRFRNRHKGSGSAVTLYKDDGSTVLSSQSITAGGSETDVGGMT